MFRNNLTINTFQIRKKSQLFLIYFKLNFCAKRKNIFKDIEKKILVILRPTKKEKGSSMTLSHKIKRICFVICTDLPATNRIFVFFLYEMGDSNNSNGRVSFYFIFFSLLRKYTIREILFNYKWICVILLFLSLFQYSLSYVKQFCRKS